MSTSFCSHWHTALAPGSPWSAAQMRKTLEREAAERGD
jgi:hypothetical protein